MTAPKTKTDTSKKHILLIEDNPGDAFLIQEMLRETPGEAFELTHADCLAAGVTCLDQVAFDLVLLDLSLPDSQGIDTFVKFHGLAPDIPVVVLTGAQNETTAIHTVRAGAQDYLVKGDVDAKLLVRSIRYAVERQGLRSALEWERQKQREGEELNFFQRLKGNSQTDSTARLFGMGPLREILPQVFEKLVHTYGILMDQALEKRLYKVEYNVSEALREMGEELGVLKALPRDVVEIHTAALSRKQKKFPPQKFNAFLEEGRFMLIEVMGYLTTYYRRNSIGL